MSSGSTVFLAALVKPFRFRFSLRVMFVAVTLLCVWLGIRAARNHAASEIVARNNIVLDLIDRNLASFPDGCSFVSPGRTSVVPLPVPFTVSQTDVWAKPGRLQPDFERQQTLTFGKYFLQHVEWISLDVSKALATQSASALGANLRRHYEQGLAEAGFHNGSREDGPAAESVWDASEHGIWVIIDADVQTDKQEARVRIKCLHSEKLSIW